MEKRELKYDYLKAVHGLPDDCMVEKNGRYYRIKNMVHPLMANGKRRHVPLHRYVLFEHAKRPTHAACHWCGYVLPWMSSLVPVVQHVVNVDHLDADTENNEALNLVPSCYWCNTNRSWAENHPEFWRLWRKWMKDVYPASRPNLIEIAADHGIYPFEETEC